MSNIKLEKQLKKNERNKRLDKGFETVLKYVLGYPIYFTLIKPCVYIKKKIKDCEESYYQKRFETVERKAMKEMKLFATERLASSFKSLSIAEKSSYERDEDLVIVEFLRNSSYRYNKKNRKFSMMYGKLFKERVEENHLKYMNEIVIWLLEEGCSIRYMKVWEGFSKVGWLVAELKKDKE